MSDDNAGFDAMSKYPLFEALHKRRSRRIGLGLKSVPAGSNTYTSNAAPQPLSELEEAILISATGLTGLTLPDRPFESSTGEKILGTPNLNFPGRAAGSTDNCQATSFFLLNDTGTYFLKRLDGVDPTVPVTPDLLVQPNVGTFRTLDFFQASAILRAAEPIKTQVKTRLEALLADQA